MMALNTCHVDPLEYWRMADTFRDRRYRLDGRRRERETADTPGSIVAASAGSHTIPCLTPPYSPIHSPRQSKSTHRDCCNDRPLRKPRAISRENHAGAAPG